MITKRLINCDFFGTSGFKIGLSNKAKLLYFLFFTHADDMGFVGNGKELAECLDHCEEEYENTLFQFKYVDAIDELVKKRLLFEFSDKCNNKTYLIRHWFFHNKQQSFLSTNYISFLSKVEVVDNEYQFKNHKEENPLKGKQIKEIQNNIKQNLKSNSLKVNDNDIDNNHDDINKDNLWDIVLNDLEKEDR